ncbi:exopolysaccharide biosynthesis protein [Chthonobacter rhizosphaerae]|uniref:exopolysaccharide biosynthesis protein n=1 Tax=Chthonobacter rhizosphaerae TaxID=2735553 RepID=UPI0015EFD93C|nr:exopolysaccharide biosynthesis protein [Chthonobacter rhizosphaerae]
MSRSSVADRPETNGEAGETFEGLGPLLDEVDELAADRGEVSLADLLKALGQASYGPLLLLPALLIISPLSAFVGFDSVMGILIALVAVQMLFGRKHVWLPQALLRKPVSQKRLGKVMRFLRPVARFTDRIIHPRMEWLAAAPYSRIMAAVCAIIGITMPPLEAIPFSNTIGAAVVSFIALGLTVRDGALIAIAIAVLVVGGGAGLYYAFG